MPTINLSDLQSAANKKFGDFEIVLPGGEEIAFVPAIRLKKEGRRKLAAAMDIEERAKHAEDEDIYDVYQDVFRLTERTKGAAAKLQKAVGDDPAVWEELFGAYVEATQPGEPSTSRV